MDQNILISTRDTLLVALPVAFMLFISVFRLDQIIARPKVSLSPRRPECGFDELGEPILRDPDGRLSGSGRRRSARK